MDVLASRVLITPVDRARSIAFYRDVLGLAVAREFGGPADGGTVFFLGNGQLEVSGAGGPGSSDAMCLWLQVRDVAAEFARLVALGVTAPRAPQLEPWGLIEAWITDPDGIRLVLVQVPAEHPLRRDQR